MNHAIGLEPSGFRNPLSSGLGGPGRWKVELLAEGCTPMLGVKIRPGQMQLMLPSRRMGSGQMQLMLPSRLIPEVARRHWVRRGRPPAETRQAGVRVPLL